MPLEVYPQGVEFAKQLIADGRVSNQAGDWHLINPDTDEQDAFIEEFGIHQWGLWHLAYHPEADQDTKSAYEFPYGNYETVAREGLMAAEERAKQYGYEEIRQAALELLELIDAKLTEQGRPPKHEF